MAAAELPLAVRDKYAAYPSHIQPSMLKLRQLVLSCVGEPNIETIEETLKWGEPSFLAKHGSTLRMDWKLKNPDQIGIYFTCQSLLVETFREIYGDLFAYEGKRAILLPVDEPMPTAQLQHCLVLALSYHKVKHLPLLGA